MPIDDELFPFRFHVDRDLVLTQIGPSLRKIARSCDVGSSLGKLVRPAEIWKPTFESIRARTRSPIDFITVESGVPLRCQVVATRENEIAVLGSPRFRSISELEAVGLTLRDFALHDAAAEFSVNGTTSLGTPQNNEFREKVNHTLNAAGDLWLRMDRCGTIIEAATNHPDLFFGCPEKLRGQKVFDAYPQAAGKLRGAFDALNERGGQETTTLSFSWNGTSVYLDARITDTSDSEIVLSARDVTEQRTLRAELLHRANHDALTNLPNRTCFMETVETALQSKELVAIFFIDLDGFKLVNDRHGHQMGDELLMHVARTIKSCLKPGDCAARLGGDEFSVLLRGIDSKQAAEQVASNILTELQKPSRIGHRTMAASASIGIATSYDSKDITTLFQFADVAMYEAKARHKCCFVSFESAMYEDLVRRDTLQQQLLAADKQGQFINHYQPIVQFHTGSLLGFEALTRWQHPIRGLLLPSDFLQTAEETEAIVRLGEHTVTNACQDAIHWHDQKLLAASPQPQIHINVSPLQLIKDCFPSMLETTLTEFGIDRERITIEIREQTLQEHFEIARVEMTKLRDMGVKLAIDDFGAGNSSLAFIDRLPVHGIKLARSFVGYLGDNKRRNRLVQSVIELALEFELQVVAVGVETLQQCDLLTRFGCTLGQGDFFSEPMDSSDCVRRFSASPRVTKLSVIA